ncbi:MAG: DUF3592 domain-containing protein [Chloroflexi bacterium]|nr:DUF3592 domain-containing protein [Chloroflexota bacterium]
MDIIVVLFSSIVELAFVGMGIFVLVNTLLATFWGIKSNSWTGVEGIITSTRIDEQKDTNYETGLTTKDYRPLINYSYEFGDVQYLSSRVSFEEDAGHVPIVDRRKAEESLARYSKSMGIRVYCNPQNPQQSTLEPGFRAEITVLYLCLSLFAVGIGMTLFFLFTLPDWLSIRWPLDFFYRSHSF